jgi:AcrR family transcriptional regulator
VVPISKHSSKSPSGSASGQDPAATAPADAGSNGSSTTSSPGRRRSPQSHAAILQATVLLLEQDGYKNLSIEAIARKAGVGKQTIYRWWPSKAAVVLEAYGDHVVQMGLPDTGSFRSDLLAIVLSMLTTLNSGVGVAMVSLIAEAQTDPDLAQQFREQFVAGPRSIVKAILERGIARSEVRDDVNLELVIDAIYGPIWYRLLLNQSPIDRQLAAALVDHLLLGIEPFEQV